MLRFACTFFIKIFFFSLFPGFNVPKSREIRYVFLSLFINENFRSRKLIQVHLCLSPEKHDNNDKFLFINYPNFHDSFRSVNNQNHETIFFLLWINVKFASRY